MNETDKRADGWGEWSRHVLAELERLNTTVGRLEECAIELKVRQARWVGGLIAAWAIMGLAVTLIGIFK